MSDGTALVRRLDHRHADPQPTCSPRVAEAAGDPRRRRRSARPGPRGREGQAGADAGRPERRPAGVARGLGPAREEPPPHLEPLRACSPAHQISPAARPSWPTASRVVLEQRGLAGNGWASAWKAAAGRGSATAARAMENVVYAVQTLHDRQPVLDLLEGHAGGRLVRHDGGARRDAAAVARE
ncbi:MAG: hypothetical protein M0C28_40035 [Candidatus Moduliflexus flocculans]|nr:hypothetical protein [Candidatus Moduliflexus flocculans]